MEGSKEYVPSSDMGGGIVDLISFAFRIVLWSIENPRSRNTFILDEPMKFVGKGILLERAGAMLQELSEQLNFQLIIVTHEEELTNAGTSTYRIRHTGRKSVAERATSQPAPSDEGD